MDYTFFMTDIGPVLQLVHTGGAQGKLYITTQEQEFLQDILNNSFFSVQCWVMVRWSGLLDRKKTDSY